MHDWDRLLGPKISNTVEKLLCESHERGRRITVTSSLNEISMDPPTTPFSSTTGLLDKYLKTT
jgi:hypothetical protein